jgi:hypothetical protein
MSVLGVIPVAGKGSRWGGYYKELLPSGNREWLLDRTIKSMKVGGADKICIVTNQSKISTHVSHINSKYENIFYVIQKEKKDIWGAMLASLSYSEDINLFAMPDTYFPINCFDREYSLNKDFWIGTHKTKFPERFGILLEDKVINKSKSLPKNREYMAWGSLVWSSSVSLFWMQEQPDTYTQAINMALSRFDYGTFDMGYYNDMATWEDYQIFLNNRKEV